MRERSPAGAGAAVFGKGGAASPGWRDRETKRMRWIVFAVVGIAATVLVAAWVSRPQAAALSPSLREGTAPQLELRRIEADVRALCRAPSRLTGSPGAQAAFDHILAELTAAGVPEVEVQDFETIVPVTEEAVLIADRGGSGVTIPLYPLWPNLARTAQTPPEGLSGPLTYLRRGADEDLRGRPIQGALAVLDWDSGGEWLSVPEFGGQAVIFRGARPAEGALCRKKLLSLPADLPRFYVSAEDLAALDALLAEPATRATVRCRAEWRRVAARNILARVADGRLPEDVSEGDRAPVIFHAYYDSISVVPDLAPGAEQALGAAALLELVRFFRAHPPDRPVYALFTGGHGQAFAGMSECVARLRQGWNEGWDSKTSGSLLARMGKPGLFVGLDLSSQSDALGLFCMGHFRGQREWQIRHKYSTLGAELARYAASFRSGSATNEPPRFVDAINLTLGRGWWTFFPYRAGFESELPTLAGFPAVTLATINDGRRFVDTPDDRVERLRLDLLARQIAADPERHPGLAALACAFTGWRGPYVSSPLGDRWSALRGRVAWLDQRRDYTPNQPLANAMVFLKALRGDKYLVGTRGLLATMTDADGRFAFEGLAGITANNQFRNCQIEAYGVANRAFVEGNPRAMEQYRAVMARGGGADEAPALDGSLLYAVDMARASDFPSRISLEKPLEHLNVVCFPSRSLTLLGLTDPRGYLPLEDLRILDAATRSTALQFGRSVPDLTGGDPEEDLTTFWADPTLRILLLLGHGFQENRLILIGNTPDEPTGRGFALNELKVLPSMVLQGARDMWNLNASRLAGLDRHGIQNPRIRELHQEAAARLAEAQARLEQRDYGAYRRAAEQGWALENKAYVEILATINNMIRGVLFYLLLLLPLSYCLERLLIASGTIQRKIIGIGTIFALCFAVLTVVHPAFRFTLTPFLVLLAFIILALVVTVSALIVSKMDAVLQEQKRAQTGYHEQQTRRGAIAARALDLGISNIRRRPQRGFLTGLSVVTVTFILLSFTSMVPTVSITRLRHPAGAPAYAGLLARDREWKPLPPPLHDSFRRVFSAREAEAPTAAVALAARAWFFSDQGGNLSQIDLRRGDDAAAAGTAGAFTAVALLCLEPAETNVTKVADTLVAGRWFREGEERGIILSEHVAAQLGYGREALGRSVRVFGEELELVGLFDAPRFDRLTDLDGEPLTPVNFVSQQAKMAQQVAEGVPPADTLETYIHYPSDQVAIVPLEIGLRFGALTRSIAVRAAPGADVRSEAEGYVRRSNLTVLGCDGREVTLYAALDTSRISAAWQIGIPVFLGFVMILGTMMGSVYERKGEIFVYNSVGLSPLDVAALFLAEAGVYAIVGAGMGYLLSQVAAKTMQATGWLSGLALNYTAGSAILVTVLSMSIVLLSALYPARQAFRAAVPDEGPEPRSGAGAGEAGADTLRLYLPFVASPEHVAAMQAYLAEYLETIQGVTVGAVAIDGLRAELEAEAGRPAPTLAFRAWMAPFDLGVSHDARLRIVYRPERGVYQYHLEAVRFSGDHQNWTRLMPRFLLAVRKQLLMWRVLSAAEREKYRARGEMLFGGGGAGAGAKGGT